MKIYVIFLLLIYTVRENFNRQKWSTKLNLQTSKITEIVGRPIYGVIGLLRLFSPVCCYFDDNPERLNN